MILIIDNYDSFTYNLAQCVEALGYECRVVRNDAITVEEIKRLNPSHIAISPGPGNPDSAGISLEVIRAFGGIIPVLGICLGHQSIGQAFGAKIVKAPMAKHGKLSEIIHDGKGVYAGLKTPFKATRYHSLIIDESTLPECLVVTSRTSDNLIMGVRHKSKAIEGVQFHPESIATENGARLIENFLKGA